MDGGAGGPAAGPAWLLVVLVVVLALGGPASMIGFDYARTFNPEYRRGAAIGIVNVGGFVASLLVALAVGVVLGTVGDRGLHAGGVPRGLDRPVRWCGRSR